MAEELKRVKVLKTVEVAINAEGTATKLIVSGTEDEILSSCYPGLLAAGYVEDVPAQKSLLGADENKMRQAPVPENKRKGGVASKAAAGE